MKKNKLTGKGRGERHDSIKNVNNRNAADKRDPNKRTDNRGFADSHRKADYSSKGNNSKKNLNDKGKRNVNDHGKF
jgi:hypothetical protein